MKALIIVVVLLMPVTALSQSRSDSVGVFTTADEMPEYPGGLSAVFALLRNNLNIPLDGIEVAGCITFYLKFIVYEDGSVHDATLSRRNENREIWNREAQRVAELMSQWRPGKVNGKPVKCYYRLPIRIRIA